MPDDFNAKIIAEFRERGGEVGGPFEGKPILLLHSTGARSGEERVHPMMYGEADGGLAVFASKGGAPTNPDWYHNLKANPAASVEVGTDAFDVRAREVTGDARAEIWEPWKRQWPQFAEYETRTSREIPVVLLERVG